MFKQLDLEITPAYQSLLSKRAFDLSYTELMKALAQTNSSQDTFAFNYDVKNSDKSKDLEEIRSRYENTSIQPKAFKRALCRSSQNAAQSSFHDVISWNSVEEAQTSPFHVSVRGFIYVVRFLKFK